ncbi:Gldg family protein [Pseudobacter ginsenosidimutans]|uniref:ABC-2 type transport system permease protein n=1 Tax=Pseudobacter ginsenosidimutans TaxID=661488 RepID=A0A4Q7MXC6_9BACT|nr:ABC transporter permease subunit [Pseudobacter ginsenosidimutans]QEC40538.1 ABC transporter permease subunit [Pseudobacter ginsenosidimutans]RZS72749.1 ABC-2 type transport system permease protein [Pseudobacter ginsenosidimutans]
MRLILTIAKNELRYLFYSPIAWCALIVFFIFNTIAYASPLHQMANYQEIMINNSNPAWHWHPGFLTSRLFERVYQNAVSYLYLFIPLLTMGLISRERKSGTMRLLSSSPAAIRQIVLGKYLGMILYLLMLVAVICLLMIIGAFNIRDEDRGLFISGILGFYLLVCAYSSIGLLMSALSTHSIIAALGVFITLFLLDKIGLLWQKYDLIRDLTWFLSLQNRTQKMMLGLVETRDIVYFLVIAAMFVCFTIIKLRSERESKPWYIPFGRYMLVMMIALMAGYTSSRPILNGYWDTTAPESNTIPIELRNMLKKMEDSSLEVTLYTNLLSTTSRVPRGFPQARNPDYLTQLWDPILRFKPDIQFNYEYFYDIDPATADSSWFHKYPGKSVDEIAARVAEREKLDIDFKLFKSPAAIRKLIDLRPEGNRMVMQLKYKGRTEFLRTLDDPTCWPDLYIIASVLKRLQEPEKISKVYFLNGELERDIRKMGERGFFKLADKSVRGSIVNMGLDVDTLNLNIQNIPKDMATLVLPDPVMELSTVVQEKIRNYLDDGGRMIILGKPGKQYVLNPLLRQLGVQLLDGQLVQPTYDETPDKVVALTTAEARNLSFEAAVPGFGMPTVTGITQQPGAYTIRPLLLTQQGRTWLKAGDLVVDSTLPQFNPRAGDRMQDTFTTAVRLTRNIRQKEQRIVVCGSADFLSNLRLGESNLRFARGAHSWLTDNHFPVRLSKKEEEDILLDISEKAAKIQKTILIWVLPGILLLTGSIILIRRKRK